jgi:glycolate oxidase
MQLTRESTLLSELASVLDDSSIVTDPDRLASYRHDMAPGVPAGEPQVVVFPRSTEQVSSVMAACHRRRVPVVPRGGGSGLSGGSNAIDGCVLLSLERMNQVLDVRVGDGWVLTQPGVMNSQLREHVRHSGLWYAPDPASKDFCSIGGNVNTNAGGLCCVKYGVTRDAVLGLEIVLADGRVSRIGRRTIKGVAGYDLVGSIVGSEGPLAVVTAARLRLRPLPPPPVTGVAVFASVADAGHAVELAMTAATPALLELMDRASIAAVEAFRPMGLDLTAEALLLVQSDLPGQAAEIEVRAVLDSCARAGAIETYRSETAEEADLLLGARRLVIPALEHSGDWLLDDVAVPRSRLAEAIAGVNEIAQTRNVLIATFGHAGDGNLHPTIVTPRGDDDAAERGRQAFDDILDLVLTLDGTITGEHGIGLLKPHALGRELDDVAVDLHARIKAAFDPAGILNPGKSLPLR